MSLVQGSSGDTVFSPAVYEYLCGRSISEIDPSIEDVPDSATQGILRQVDLL